MTLSDVDHNIDIEHLADGCIYCTEHCAWIVSLTHAAVLYSMQEGTVSTVSNCARTADWHALMT